MRALFAVFLLVFSLNSNAQNWPSKPMRYIVPFPPGAFNDTLGRTISAELSKIKAANPSAVFAFYPGGLGV